MASPAPATTQQPPPLDVDELLKCGTSKPLPFVVTDEKGMFYVDPDTAKIIAAINKPLVVVSIVGKYRTGKSFFMNRLAGSNTGFSLGRGIEVHTKGIWVWPRPHPDYDKYLLLLDTEGLGDVQKGNEHHDMWICGMAVLLSSTMVWNIMGVLDHQNLQQLNFITNITEHVQTRKTQTENEQELEVDNYFPNFIVCIRDFTLKLELNQTPCTADEYLEHSLNPPKDDELRMQRKTLCTYFKNRKCFVFRRPVEEDNLDNLENVADDKLRPGFLDAAKQFKEYVLQTSTVKQIKSITLIGPSFLTLVEGYVNSSNNPNSKLCIECTRTHVVNTSNKSAKDKEIGCCNKNMELIKTRFPLHVQDFCTLHNNWLHKQELKAELGDMLRRIEILEERVMKDKAEEHSKMENDAQRAQSHQRIDGCTGLSENTEKELHFSETIQGNGTFHVALKENLHKDFKIVINEEKDKRLVFIYPCSRDEDEIKKCENMLDIAAIIFLHRIHPTQSNDISITAHPVSTHDVFSIYYNDANNVMYDIPHNKSELERMKTVLFNTQKRDTNIRPSNKSPTTSENPCKVI